MSKVCPDCGNDKFTVTAIEWHTWIIGSDGVFREDLSCDESEIPDSNPWTCTECGNTFDGPKDLVDPNAPRYEDVDPPDEDDDPKWAYERMTDLEHRYNRM